MAYKIKTYRKKSRLNRKIKRVTRKRGFSTKLKHKGRGPGFSKPKKCIHNEHSDKTTYEIKAVTGEQGEWRLHLKCSECGEETTISCFSSRNLKGLFEHKQLKLSDCEA